MISSKANETIKNIRKLRNKKYREETGLAYVEGHKIIIDALNARNAIEKIIFSESFTQAEKNNPLLDRTRAKNYEIVYVTDEVFASISGKENPKGIGVVIKQDWHIGLPHPLSGTWVGLYEVADPGNLGTIIRTLDAVGGNGIILIGNSTDPYDPGALRASMGAIFSVKIVKTSLADFVDWAGMGHITIFGTSDQAEDSYMRQEYEDDMILLMGSERQGLPQELIKICKHLISLPMFGTADSLNLSVATGVFLYDVLEKRMTREAASD